MLELRTIGHATLVLVLDGQPVLATDPWLVGSTYWRSWWLERYPTDDEIELVRQATYVYITHSHPDHFHWPSLRRLGPKAALLPRFPRHALPGFLREHGYPVEILEPWAWYAVGEGVRIVSVPTPIDDSMLVIDTPMATVVNINDANPRLGVLSCMRRRFGNEGKPLIVLKSYSPASIAVSMYRDGERLTVRSKEDYARTAQRYADALGATHFIPFASQAFFDRSDSRWANQYKVSFEDLERHWESDVVLCKPLVTMDLRSLEYTSVYDATPTPQESQRAKVITREAEEASFDLPDDFESKLKRYLDAVYFLRHMFRKGIGWRLTTSGQERFYDTRTKTVHARIPPRVDFVMCLPDQVLYEALSNNVLTDLGITMFTRVDTSVGVRRTYAAFFLMGMHDYGHFDRPRDLARFIWFYLPYVFPGLLHARLAARRASTDQTRTLKIRNATSVSA